MRLIDSLNQFLLAPRKVLLMCLILAGVGTVLDGTLYKIWSLNNERKNVEAKVTETQKSIQTLQKQIKMAHDPKFIEREARNRFDLVNKDDVVFVFADE